MWCMWLLAAGLARPALAQLPYGVELDGLASFSTLSPFTDATTIFSAWQTYDPNGPALQLDSENYPTLGTKAQSSSFLRAYPGWRAGTPENRPVINYRISWEDGGAGGSSIFFINQSLINITSLALPNGHIQYTGTLPFQYDASSGEASLALRVDNTLANTTYAVSNLHIVPQQYINPQTNTAPIFREEFLRKVSMFSVLRMMDWQQTNSGGLDNLASPPSPFVDNRVVNWSDRVTTTSFSRTTTKGVPWEEIISLSNTFVRRDAQSHVVSKKDIWINIPDRASDDYINGLGSLLKLTLDPAVNIYLEYSNELWNTGSDVDRWRRVLQDARANITPQGQYGVLVNDGVDPNNDNRLIARQMAYKLTYFADMLKSIIDAPNTPVAASRIKPILAGQTPNSTFLQYSLDFLARRKYGDPATGNYQKGNLSNEIYGIAVAPYVGNDLGAAEPNYPDPPIPGDPDYATKLTQYNADRTTYLNWLFPVLNAYIDGPLKDGIDAHKNMANDYNISLQSYEAGQHLIARNPVQNIEINGGYKQDANRDPRMGDVYRHLLTMWAQESGGGVFSQFALISPYSSFGSWGLLEDLLQSTSPKWDVFTNLLGGDANLDGVVNFTDFQILEANFNHANMLWDQGDFNFDGKVDYQDFLIFRGRFTPDDPAAAQMVGAFELANVPEPGMGLLLGLAAATLLRRRRAA